MNVSSTTKLSFEVISPHRVLDELYCLENSKAPGYGDWLALRPGAFSVVALYNVGSFAKF